MTRRAMALDGLLVPDTSATPTRRRASKQKTTKARTTVGTPPIAFSSNWTDPSPPPQGTLRAQALLPLCRPAVAGEAGTFQSLGILPHGKPLFLDGSTTCASCNRVMFYEHLTDGKCLPCAACKHYAGAVTRCRNCNIALEHHSDPAAEYQKELIRRAQQEAARQAREAEQVRREAAEERRGRRPWW